LGEDFAKRLECLGGIGAEVDDGEQIGAVAVVKMLDGIAGEEGDVEAGVDEGLAEGAHVFGVFGEEAIFVFYLDHQDGAAVGDLEGLEFTADFHEVLAGGVEIS